jgi:hypothetical protein
MSPRTEETRRIGFGWGVCFVSEPRTALSSETVQVALQAVSVVSPRRYRGVELWS